MRIAYLLQGGLFNPGGMERVITTKADYLTKMYNYEVFIITTEQMGRPVFFPVSEKVRLCHLDIHIGKYYGKENYIQKIVRRFIKIQEYKKKLSKLLKEIRPDITITTLGGLDIDFINDLKDGSIKIGELHFPRTYRKIQAQKMYRSFLPNLVGEIMTAGFIRNCKKLKRLIVLTEEEKASWDETDNIEVIPNALSFYPETTSDCGAKKAIAVGRLVYEKGFDMLIDAWKAVYKKHSDWELHIYGEGSEKENLLNQIQQENLNGVVKIHEPVKDIYNQYLHHSMMLFPSRFLEALPMVLLEAMSCGLPIIAYDAPCGPKDVIREGVNGFLVKTGNIEALSVKINDLIESDEMRKRMGKVAREMSFDYEVEKIMKRWLKLFETLKN
jgi:glycosyltransferase involved in cell wall biosynthesis